MRRTAWEALAALVLVIAAVPAAGAAITSLCEDVTRSTTAPAAGHHLVVDNASGEANLWEETNDVEGLQTEECTRESGAQAPADQHVLTVPPSLPNPSTRFPTCSSCATS